jgi:hypothetical protein
LAPGEISLLEAVHPARQASLSARLARARAILGQEQLVPPTDPLYP